MTGALAVPAYLAASALLIGAYLLLAHRRWVGAALFLLVILGSAAVLSRTLGRPMPVSWEISGPESLDLIAVEMQEGTAIYLWVRTPAGPKSYALDWDLQKARSIYAAQQQAERDGTGVIVDGLFDDSDGDLVAHARPVEAMPLKQESAP